MNCAPKLLFPHTLNYWDLPLTPPKHPSVHFSKNNFSFSHHFLAQNRSSLTCYVDTSLLSPKAYTKTGRPSAQTDSVRSLRKAENEALLFSLTSRWEKTCAGEVVCSVDLLGRGVGGISKFFWKRASPIMLLLFFSGAGRSTISGLDELAAGLLSALKPNFIFAFVAANDLLSWDCNAGALEARDLGWLMERLPLGAPALAPRLNFNVVGTAGWLERSKFGVPLSARNVNPHFCIFSTRCSECLIIYSIVVSLRAAMMWDWLQMIGVRLGTWDEEVNRSKHTIVCSLNRGQRWDKWARYSGVLFLIIIVYLYTFHDSSD